MSELTFMRKSGPMFVPKYSTDGKAVQGWGFMHYCAHPQCFEWGSFGVKVNLKMKELGAWYCRQHLPPQGGDHA